jgi:hypothetical protein
VLFEIEEDTGNQITGYLVPDSYSSSATVVVTSQGRQLAVLPTKENRPSVVAAGRHGTGRCGFTIDGNAVPHLRKYAELELRDEASGLVFYRRRPSAMLVPMRLFRLEPRHVRSQAWDQQLGEHFQVSFPNADQLGRETTTQTLVLRARSLYISARLFYREFLHSIDDSFKKVCIVQDPYVELAEIMLELRLGAAVHRNSLDMRDQLAFGACAEHISQYDILDAADLRQCLLRMPRDVEAVLSSPMTRLLAAKSPDEHLSSGSVASGLDSLTSFDIVGVREHPNTYLESLLELLATIGDLPPLPPASPEALELAEGLRGHSSATALIDLDIDIYHTLSTALGASFPWQ